MPTRTRNLAPIAEAATLKARAKALYRDLESVLADKALPSDVAEQLTKIGAALKKKWADLADDAKASADESASPATEAAWILGEAAAILMQDDSYAGTMCLVQDALNAIYPSSTPMGYYDDDWGWCGNRPMIVDLYDDVVIYRYHRQLWRCDFSIDDSSGEDVVTLGEPSPVEAAYVPDVPTRAALGEALMRGGARAGCFLSTDLLARLVEAPVPADPPTVVEASHEVAIEGDLVPLVEKAVRKDGTLDVKVIQPGWGSSGYYPADILKRDGPKVFTNGMQMFWNHQTAQEAAARPEGDLRDLAAVLTSDVEWRQQGPSGPGLYATARALGEYGSAIESLAPHIGVSIRAFGKAKPGEAEGKSGQIIEELTAGQSVDFVTQAGAGGEILQLFEAARGRTASPTTGGQTVDDEQARALREANAAHERRIQEMEQTIARQQEAILLRDAREHLTGVLRSIDMPDVTRSRLGESLIGKAPIKDGALDRPAYETLIRETVKGELAYLGQATGLGDGRIRGMGAAADPAGDPKAATDALAESLGRLGNLSAEHAQVAANGRR
jgi:hypothetical protein